MADREISEAGDIGMRPVTATADRVVDAAPTTPDFWAAMTDDKIIEMSHSTDDGNGGEASRQEVNDWINENDPRLHLVGLYARPPAPRVPSTPTATDIDALMNAVREHGPRWTNVEILAKFPAMLAAAPGAKP